MELQNLVSASTDYAFLKTDSGQIILGRGPFAEAATAPKGGIAFYVNDFDLSDPLPWKIPASHEFGPDLESLVSEINGAPKPQIEWEGVQNAGFQTIYEDIKHDIDTGTLEKSVPVFTERGSLKGGALEALVHCVEHLPPSFFSYGFRRGADGFIGATPELLFAAHGQRLETMALAGTTSIDGAAAFQHDEKEIHEHEFVAKYLISKLSQLGQVRRENRQLLELGSIAHFISPIHVDLDDDPDFDSLIRLMHPTPALGPFPRTQGSLAKLRGYRDELEAPLGFGAPFGAFVDGTFHAVVAIRNVSWSGNDVFLPSGCGVVAESNFENEWRELGLKRHAVRDLLGL
ncbi:MAG: menaquinone-specific isochorismate synthase [Verrucomicrobiales bacterium]